MNEYSIYLGIVLILFGVFRFLRLTKIYSNNDTVEAEVTKVKEKTRKGRSYTYPKVKVVEETFTREFYCYTAKVSGHDKYYEGQQITLYRYRTLKGESQYIAKKNPSFELSYSVAGIVVLIYYFFML